MIDAVIIARKSAGVNKGCDEGTENGRREAYDKNIKRK
jgi:hypothetical protein